MAAGLQDGKENLLLIKKTFADQNSKVAYLSYVALQCTLLALWSDMPKTKLTLTCAIVTTLGYSMLSVLSYFEHKRSIRPSTMLIVYLALSLLLDLARVRTLFFIPLYQTIARIFLVTFLTKIFLLVLESTEKRHLLLAKWKTGSPEAASGVINRAMFLWLNAMFFKGFRTILSVKSLPEIDDEILSASEPRKLLKDLRSSE